MVLPSSLLASSTKRALALPSLFFSPTPTLRPFSLSPSSRTTTTTMPFDSTPPSPSSPQVVGTGISLFPGSLSRNEKDPKMVVLCGWMGAAMPHLQKYVSLHQEVFPGVPILLLRSEPSAFFQTERRRFDELKPALELIPKDGVFWHACSNGGTLKLTDLVPLLPSSSLPSSSSSNVLLLDSTPGTASYSRTIQAFLLPFPSLLPFLPTFLSLAIGRTLLSLLYLLNRAFHVLTRTPDVIEQTRTKIQSQFPPGTVNRTYVYSKEDALIDWRDVESHGEDAERLGGGGVRMERVISVTVTFSYYPDKTDGPRESYHHRLEMDA
ncbi:hypothetical protein BDY24DRAFT_440943 [Mrakia frigida]|uniref:uncharacterized protein n=1 Tax=Mrakia frigida TaxID=29902 RepID=UPI003FCBF51F